MKITVLGAGLMGSALIQALLNHHHAVTIVDLHPEKAQPLVDQGAKYTPNLANALDSDLIIANLPTVAITQRVLADLPGQLDDQFFLNTCTATIDETTQLANQVAKLGGRYLDGKIECWPQDINTPNAYLIYSGSATSFATLKPVLTAFSAEPDFISDQVTAASAVDMGPSLDVFYGIYNAALEGCALALKNGVPIEKCLEIISAALPGYLAGMKRQFTAAFQEGIPTEYPEADGATVTTHQHALKAVVQSMKESGVQSPMATAALRLMDAGQTAGEGQSDFTALMKVLVNRNPQS